MTFSDDRCGRRLPVDERGLMPAVDVFEKANKFVVKAELPGMKEEDIDVSVVGGQGQSHFDVLMMRYDSLFGPISWQY